MAVAAIGRIGHQDRLSIVGHLEELRTRLIVCAVAIGLAFGLCLWQNHRILHLINKPLATQTQKQVRAGHGSLGAAYEVQLSAQDVARQLQVVVRALDRSGSGASAATRAAVGGVTPSLHKDIKRLSRPPEGDKPVTLGIGEPFTTTIGVSMICALILALPIVLWELYGFMLPAVDPKHQRAARPLVAAVPVLFAAGVLFGYLVVLPAAVRFFQNFNSDQFNVLVQASQYYKFAALVLLAMGVIFQVPVGILAATQAGIVTPRQLRHHRRYALLVCAAVAAFIPGDVTTMALETIPLYLLFEASVLFATIIERRKRSVGDGDEGNTPAPA